MPTVGQKQMKRNRILDVLFPPRCPVCDDLLEPELVGESYMHVSCQGKFIPVQEPMCIHCGRPIEGEEEYCFDCSRKDLSQSFIQGKTLYLYQGSLRKTLYRFKYSNKREYADFFADTAVRMWGDWMKKKGIEVIIPVPMYGPKRRKRGYNQAECFAKALSRQTGIAMDSKWVQRCRDTAPQKGLNDIQRQNNLKQAFCQGNSDRIYTRVLVVDDIYTTGSTADAVTEVLHAGGIQEVYFISIAIGAGS